MKNACLYLFLAAFLLDATPSLGCTSFGMKSQKSFLLAKSYDFKQGHGLLIVNKRGVAKKSMSSEQSAAVKWTSKFGSVTFNQQARELPSGGINEKGLALELMWLIKGKYPEVPKGAKSINELQWIQYQLDNFSSVSEVLANLKKLQIKGKVAPLHYLVCDSTEHCAVIDFVDGKMQVYQGADMPVAALTNHNYKNLLDQYNQHKSQSKKSAAQGDGSIERFIRVATELTQKILRTSDPAKKAFSMLETVAVSSKDIGVSQWNIVYNLTDRKVLFKTRQAPGIKSLSLNSLDFSCSTPVEILDLNSRVSGNIRPALTKYKIAANAKIVKESQKFISQRLPPKVAKAMEKGATYYPESTKCVKKK